MLGHAHRVADRPPARLLPCLDGARAAAAPRPSCANRWASSLNGSARRPPFGRSSASARCWSRCATHPIRGCLLEVAMVQLTNPHADASTAALVARIEQLEQAVARIGAGGLGAGGPVLGAGTGCGRRWRRGPGRAPCGTTGRPTPQDPATGRAVLGGRARRPDPSTTASAAADSSPSSTASPGSVPRPHPHHRHHRHHPHRRPLRPPLPHRRHHRRRRPLRPRLPHRRHRPRLRPTTPPRPKGALAHPPAASAPVAVRSDRLRQERTQADLHRNRHRHRRRHRFRRRHPGGDPARRPRALRPRAIS